MTKLTTDDLQTSEVNVYSKKILQNHFCSISFNKFVWNILQLRLMCCI